MITENTEIITQIYVNNTYLDKNDEDGDFRLKKLNQNITFQ
jgi:hypothetical protein